MENTNNNETAKQLEVIQSLRNYNPIFVKSCYAVGLWIWAEFPQRLSQDEVNFIKSVGFKWNKVRKLWQNACGVKKRNSAGDPRTKYPIVVFNED